MKTAYKSPQKCFEHSFKCSPVPNPVSVEMLIYCQFSGLQDTTGDGSRAEHSVYDPDNDTSGLSVCS